LDDILLGRSPSFPHFEVIIIAVHPILIPAAPKRTNKTNNRINSELKIIAGNKATSVGDFIRW
jgi:hypothetical protein